MKKIYTLVLCFITLLSTAQTPLVGTSWVDTLGTPAYYYSNVVDYIDTSRHVLLVFNSDATGIYSQSTIDLIDNSGGAMNWQTDFTIPGYVNNFGTAAYIKGRYAYVTGVASDSANAHSNIYIYKLNLSDGSTVWDTVYAGGFAGYEVPVGIFVDDTGHVYIAGTEQIDTFNYQVFLLKYDSLGHRQFVGSYDSVGLYSGAVGLALFGNQVVVTGYSGSSYSSWDFLTVGFNIGTGSVQNVSRSGNAGGNFSRPAGIIPKTTSSSLRERQPPLPGQSSKQ